MFGQPLQRERDPEKALSPLIQVWKTVHHRAFSSFVECSEMLKLGKRKPSLQVCQTFEQVPPRSKEIMLPLVCVSTHSLGFSLRTGAHHDELLERISRFGAPCPTDTPFQLARDYGNQPRRQKIRIVTETPVLHHGDPHLYELAEDYGCHMRLETARSSDHYGPHALFVFALQAQPPA